MKKVLDIFCLLVLWCDQACDPSAWFWRPSGRWSRSSDNHRTMQQISANL